MQTQSRTCATCNNEVAYKRAILCGKCWNGLSDVRKQAVQRATYRRDEVGRKFVTELLTCDLKVLKQIIAESNGGTLEPTKVARHLGSTQLEQAIVRDEQKQEAKEIV